VEEAAKAAAESGNSVIQLEECSREEGASLSKEVGL